MALHEGHHPQLYPMWVVAMEDLLQMHGVPPSHQELKDAGLLVECKPSFHSVFVSHQWLGKHHPDEKGSQFSVLQKAFENIINGHIEVELDIPLQWSGYTRSISKADRKELRRGYVWLDWFSIPQIEVKEQGVEDEQMRGDVLLAVQSIPFYVETCKLFVALVPQLQHNDLHTECNYCTWLNRGWCRLEIWCNLLSHHNEAPFVVIQDCDHAEFSMPVHWVRESAHEGYFTVESDRSRVAQVMQTAFESKIASLRIEEQTKQRTQLFRYLLAGKSRLLGLPTPSLTPESFPKYFGFDSLESALKQKTGMVATACAVLAEDTATLRWLAKAGAELNPQLPGIMEVGLTRGWTPLHLAVSHCSDPGIVQELLNLRANPNSCNRGGMPALGCCTSVAAVDLMLFHRADANFCQQPGGLTPLALSTTLCAPPSVVRRLLQARADPNGRGCGIGHAALSMLAISANGNPNLAEHVQILLAAGADVNQGGHPQGPVRVYELLCRFFATFPWFRLGEKLALVEVFAAEASSTALGVASLLGREQLVQLLLEANGDPMLPNSRGNNAGDLARRRLSSNFNPKSLCCP